MKDTRAGAERQKPVKGAVDKAGKKGMPKPAERPVQQPKPAKAAEAGKKIRAQEKGKAPRGEVTPRIAPPPARKAQATRPASRPAARPEGRTGAAGTPKSTAPTGPVKKAVPVPLPKGIFVPPKDRAPRGRVVGTGPKRIPPSIPGYNPGFPTL